MLVIPKTFVDTGKNPVIFLAGPIRGAPNWQDTAAEYLLSKAPQMIVVSPRRGVRPRIEGYLARGDENSFPRQRAWERHYLDIAARTGCIMFWLPGEKEHDCRKAYGAMTRLELGQVMTRYRFDGRTRFCIGSDGMFSELDTILYDLSLDAPDKKVFSTLRETCDEAIRIALA